ncbi:MAG: E3 binding domain-containing protein, partial [Acidobacteriota bacterium]|nr:E3 binding domain-containing protein [Acidobacteriota bacterium]
MIDVVMPQMGESIVEGTLTKWLKKPGDTVERDEPLFEISTDKVDTEIPSPAAGKLSEVLVEEGKTVGINTVVARISDGDGASAAPAKPVTETAPPPPAAPPGPAVEPEPKPVAQAPAAQQPAAQAEPEKEAAGPLSPLVRKMAREHSIDLGRITGTGAGNRITKQDVEQYLAAQQSVPQPTAQTPPQPQTPPPAAAPPPAQAQAATPAPAAPAPQPQAGQAKTRVEPMSSMRIKIAEHMVMSKRTSAHVTTV